MSRRQFSWTQKQFDKLSAVQKVLEELHNYKPLTLRQIYYQLVSKEIIENKVSEYTMLSKLLKQARIDDYVPWEDIEDRTRIFHDSSGYADKNEYVETQLHYFLNSYKRDLLQSQNNYIEVWIEKDALSSLFTRACSPYCVSTIVCKGFSSVSFLNDFRTRLMFHTDKQPVMLYFGDFDPSGVEMLEAMKTTLQEELNVIDVDFKRVALLRGDIFEYKLPHNPSALKTSDTRAKKHLAHYGELAVELDSLPPDILQQKIKNAIEEELDITAFNQEVERYYNEVDLLNELKEKVRRAIDI